MHFCVGTFLLALLLTFLLLLSLFLFFLLVTAAPEGWGMLFYSCHCDIDNGMGSS